MNGSKTAARAHGSVLGALINKAPSAGIGVVAAVLTVLAIDHLRAGRPATSTAHAEAAEQVPLAAGGERVVRNVVVDPQAFSRIAELERQMNEMQVARTAAAAAGSAAPEEPTPDAAETRRKVDALYAELDRAHERDAADPQWAPSATKGFVGGLTALGEKAGFTVGQTECKTTSCRSVVTWPNYAAARATGAQLVEHYFGGLNCGQKIRLSEPSDPNAPYSAQLYLDCTDLRAGVADQIVAARAD